MAQCYSSARNAAFHRQDGRCFYCNFSMWLTDRAGFAATHDLTLRQASRLQAAPDPDRFCARVQSRVKHRHWHPRTMFHVLIR